MAFKVQLNGYGWPAPVLYWAGEARLQPLFSLPFTTTEIFVNGWPSFFPSRTFYLSLFDDEKATSRLIEMRVREIEEKINECLLGEGKDSKDRKVRQGTRVVEQWRFVGRRKGEFLLEEKSGCS